MQPDRKTTLRTRATQSLKGGLKLYVFVNSAVFFASLTAAVMHGVGSA